MINNIRTKVTESKGILKAEENNKLLVIPI